ncbi:MAG: nucleotidyltransferase domain-containing protein [Pseudonocardiaceae bacterium]
MTPAELRERLSTDPAAAALRLAVLHGSRARADTAERSDWDIGVLADDPWTCRRCRRHSPRSWAPTTSTWSTCAGQVRYYATARLMTVSPC